MNKIINTTTLAYRNALVIPAVEKKARSTKRGTSLVLAFLSDLAYLGYTLEQKLVSQMKYWDDESIVNFRNETVAVLNNVLGSDVDYKPLFRKFPDDVPNEHDYLLRRIVGFVGNVYPEFGNVLSDVLFNINAAFEEDSYVELSNGVKISKELFDLEYFNACPITQLQVSELTSRPALETTPIVHNAPLKTIFGIDEKGVLSVFENLLASKGSISERDQKFIEEVLKENTEKALASIPEEIPMKENLAFFVAKALAYGDAKKLAIEFAKLFKTATDVIRLAEVFSGGDQSLATHTKFKLTNPQRKLILGLINSLKNPEEDMVRFRMLWVRLFEYLHIGAFAKTYKNAAEYANTIRNDADSVETFNSKVEALLLKLKPTDIKAAKSLVNLLKTRPGDFARRLDHLLRKTNHSHNVIDDFLSVARKVATPLLLNLSAHFSHRDSKASVRVYLPKGKTSNMLFSKDNRDLLKPHDLKNLVSGIDNILIERFKEQGSLGSVFIDPALKSIIVPTSMRNTNAALQTLARGSRVGIDPESKKVRLFCYWEDIKDDDSYYGRVDLDLSLMMFNKDLEQKGVVSYYALSNDGIQHSGDIQSAPFGAAEFVDVDIDKVLQKGIHYIAITVNSFTGQKFDQFVAKAGLMSRDGVTGAHFEPKTVEQKYDITSTSTFCIPMIFDLVNREIIWMDLSTTSSGACKNIGSESTMVEVAAKYATEVYRDKSNMYRLFELHAKGRATSVDTVFDKNKVYDHVFDINSATRVDEILNKWL